MVVWSSNAIKCSLHIMFLGLLSSASDIELGSYVDK
jgi:hypothetical protein